jgi:hypothetical protein
LHNNFSFPFSFEGITSIFDMPQLSHFPIIL